jgi:hypothetical protein
VSAASSRPIPFNAGIHPEEPLTPPGLAIDLSQRILERLEGLSPGTHVDGISVATHRQLHLTMKILTGLMYLLRHNTTAMRSAIYLFHAKVAADDGTRSRNDIIPYLLQPRVSELDWVEGRHFTFFKVQTEMGTA